MLNGNDFNILNTDFMPEFLTDSDINFISSLSSEQITVFPGFCDVHVHFREPGFSYKETIETGTKAAARGGYTAVCTMPNLSPVPDSVENLKLQTDIIKKDAIIKVFPFGAVSVNEMGERLSDMEGMAPDVIGFSDDGKGVQSDELMLQAMKKAKKLNKIISAHCEDNSFLHGGYIHDGAYAKEHNHKGICSESEWRQIERDINLLKKSECSYHVCHISCKESVDLIRRAKKEGLDITCETAPHYLVLDDSKLKEEGRFKMNPPIRSAKDRYSLIEGIIDGTVDMIATDHAPHSAEEKSRGLEKSPFGIVGLETSFGVLNTKLVKEKIISLKKLIELMSVNPSKRFGISLDGDYTVWNLNKKYTVNSDNFISKGHSTPFDGYELYGECLMTVCNGKIAWKNGGI